MLGYWRRSEDTAASRIDDWHRTVDLGVVDSEGFVTLVARSKELYISGGENVYPAEIERVLATWKWSEVAVVGVPTIAGRSGSRVRGAAAPAVRLRRALGVGRRAAGALQASREIVVVAELPRTASGKVQKHVLSS